ncbi:MAG: 4-(cytidine 5'-diphospho)-2-C-methyl-D-erythritol kinase [Chromatiaceae bacterium]|nr:4-(cytidine 5'-diphospho)-2-C-methyl-D-erythritol kinase [Chromatiaceae bacterium]MCP5446783.1 4-(cytidine 5'-diphospho)-2-C-methyl-D-erythritol kinase [Chromatiaceae bacterium]
MSEGLFEYWPAPAKLNLMLRIVGRRPDGYHLLQTVFQFLDIGDQIGFRVRQDGRIRRINELPGVVEESDLVVRAAKLLQQHSGTPLGVDLYIEKKLPMGAGLGGGSSDAATVLMILNRLWDVRGSIDQLADLGLTLGADVPVFVRGRSAWGEGIGEKLEPIDLPCPWYLVLVPSCHVSTAEIFSDPDLTRNSPRIKIRDFLDGSVQNDCLPVVCRRYPPVREALQWLSHYSTPRLTGTGAAVFASFEHEDLALQVHRKVPEGYRSYVVRGVNHSPLGCNRVEKRNIQTGCGQ